MPVQIEKEKEVFTIYPERETKERYLKYCEKNNKHKHNLLNSIIKEFLEKNDI